MQRALLLASLSLLGTLAIAPAATRTWVGSVSTDFYDPANWSPNGVPASSDTLNVTNGSVAISPGFVSSGQIIWTGGTLYGALVISTGATMAISGQETKHLWCNLTNAGSITLSSPLEFDDNDRQLMNAAGALFDVQRDVGISGGWSGQRFLNAGTFRKSGGTNTLTLSAVTFANSGLLDIQSGTLTLDTALAMNGGSIHSILQTTGHSSLSEALVGAVNWTNGTMYGGFAVATNGTLAVSGPDTKYLNCNLTNAGTITLSVNTSLDASISDIKARKSLATSSTVGARFVFAWSVSNIRTSASLSLFPVLVAHANVSAAASGVALPESLQELLGWNSVAEAVCCLSERSWASPWFCCRRRLTALRNRNSSRDGSTGGGVGCLD
jgi:hypothetical protein